MGRQAREAVLLSNEFLVAVANLTPDEV